MACASASLSEARGLPQPPFAPVRPSRTTPALITRSVGTPRCPMPPVSPSGGHVARATLLAWAAGWAVTLHRAATPDLAGGVPVRLQIPASDQSLRREGGFCFGRDSAPPETSLTSTLFLARREVWSAGVLRLARCTEPLRAIGCAESLHLQPHAGVNATDVALPQRAAAERDCASSGAASRRCGRQVKTEEATLLLARAACRGGGACRGVARASAASCQPPASRAARSRRCHGRGTARRVAATRERAAAG